jgi:hypothetical protein
MKGMKIQSWSILTGAILFLLSAGCFVIENQYTGLPPGPWRAILKLDPAPVIPNPRGEPLPEKVNLTFDEVTQGELPFNFEVIYENEQDFYMEIINGNQRIRVDEIRIGLDRQTAKDTITIAFPDSYIQGIFQENVLEGEWVVTNRENYSIPFVAYHGQDHRFTNLRKAAVLDISGRWEATFEIGSDNSYLAVAVFRQEGNHITGTFLTEKGDYQNLEGTVQRDKVYLSTFDGANAFLIEAKIREDSTLIGSFRSGIHYKALWEARRNPNAKLSSQ